MSRAPSPNTTKRRPIAVVNDLKEVLNTYCLKPNCTQYMSKINRIFGQRIRPCTFDLFIGDLHISLAVISSVSSYDKF